MSNVFHFFHAYAFPVFISVPVSLDFSSVFFIYERSICTLSLALSSSPWLSSRLGAGSAGMRLTCSPRGGVGCAWNRNLNRNVCPGRGLNLAPLNWQPSTQSIDYNAAPLMSQILRLKR